MPENRRNHWHANDNLTQTLSPNAALHHKINYPNGAARHKECAEYCTKKLRLKAQN